MEVSDHCAVVVKSMLKDWGPQPFRSIDAWQMESDFKELVKDKWNSYVVRRDGITNFKDKLKILKEDLKVWNREVFGNLEVSKNNILKQIEVLDNQDNNSEQEESTKMKSMELMSQLKEIENKIDSLLCQKVRSNWLKHGDLNSKFYHSSIKWRRIRNEVKGVEVGGQWCEDPEVVRGQAKNLFEERFTATKDFGVRLGAVEFKTISQEDKLSLISAFSEEEIREAVRQCDGSKSPGPDGFNLSFIHKNWETLKEDIYAAVSQFHESGTIPKGCNASLIALIPKVRDPMKLDQYRPISLVGSCYKIISKILSNRIKKVLPSVIDECQSAFLKDRGMLDSVLMANEIFEDIMRNKKRGLCLKVDFEKAYDSGRWEFLYDMLQRLIPS